MVFGEFVSSLVQDLSDLASWVARIAGGKVIALDINQSRLILPLEADHCVLAGSDAPIG
jgi:hypothetical protein